MNERVGENKSDLSNVVLKPKIKKRFNRQNNITIEEDQVSLSSVRSSAKPLVSILTASKKDSNAFTVMSSASSTLPKIIKRCEKQNLSRINSQKSVIEHNALFVTNNINEDFTSRKSSFNSVRYLFFL